MGDVDVGGHRPLLLVLSIDSGLDFPSSGQGSVLKVKARLDEAWLESGEVSASPNPQFGTELAWEVAEEQLKELRRQRATVRVEVWRNSNEMLGHQILDVRTAVALSETDSPGTTWHKLKGCSTPSLRLGLGLAVLPGEEKLASPQLVEGEEGGYFILKPGEEGGSRSTLSVTIQAANGLVNLTPPGVTLPPSDSLYFHYSLLGVDVSTEPFQSLAQPSFPPETATARLRASSSTLDSFLSSSQLSVHLCHGSSILATATLAMSALTPNSGGEAIFEGVLPLVPVSSKHTQAAANLTILMCLRPDLPHIIATTAEMPCPSPIMPSPPTRLARDEAQPVIAGDSPRMERGASFDLPNASKALDFSVELGSPSGPRTLLNQETPLADVTQQTDCTVYQSPPPAKHPRLVPTSLFQPPQSTTSSAPTRAFRLSLELINLTLNTGSEGVVLAYKYTALHPSVISTAPGFPVPAGQKSNIPRGYCEFSFAVQEQRMVDTFRRHPLRVVVKGSGNVGKLGIASLDLSSVLQNGQVAAEQQVEGVAEFKDESKQVVGNLRYQITLSWEDPKGGNSSTREQHMSQNQMLPVQGPGLQSNFEVGDAWARARMEVEAWKEEEKKRFKSSLAEKEAEHLRLLGREWKEREVERESSLQESWQKIRRLEQELREEIEGVKKEKELLEESKKTLEAERGEVLKVRQEVHGGKSNLISKLKSKIKELESEFEIKVLETDSLKKHLESVKKDLEKKENTRNEKKSREDNLLSEVMQLRADKNTWESKIEHVQKERDFFANNCEMLNKEVVELRREKEEAYTGQITRLEERVRELSCQLETKNSPPTPSPSPTPVLLSEPEQISNTRRMEEERGELEGRIARLQENYDMLLRTGVYKIDDPVVVSLRTRMDELRAQIPRPQPLI